MTTRRCLFLSHDGDLHTAVIAKLLHEEAGVQVDHLSANSFSCGDGLTVFDSADSLPSSLLDFAAYDLVWSRRIRMPQKATKDLAEEARAFVDAECAAAIEGACLIAEGATILVNPLQAERRAESKLWQLKIAREVGFDIPRTICSNKPEDIRAAVAQWNGAAVAKKLRGTYHRTPLTLPVRDEMLADAESLRAAPFVLQERICAARHFRVHIFLDEVTAIQIHSAELDWRPGAARGAEEIELSEDLDNLCRSFRRRLGLIYCILDLVEDQSGKVLFLECNPQGQFLFLEYRSGVRLASRFASMLLHVLTNGAEGKVISQALPR